MNVKSVGDGCVNPAIVGSQPSHLHNVFRGEFVPYVVFSAGGTATLPMASFRNAIPTVVLLGSKPEMRWIDTSWVVSTRAIVKNTQVVRDAPAVQLPRHPVRVMTLVPNTYLPVSKVALAPVPYPTSVWVNCEGTAEEFNGVRGKGHALMMN